MTTEHSRYRYSVHDVSIALHGEACGTSQGMMYPAFYDQLDWLKWRVEEAWSEEPLTSEVDKCVRELARAVIRECEACEWMRQPADKETE